MELKRMDPSVIAAIISGLLGLFSVGISALVSFHITSDELASKERQNEQTRLTNARLDRYNELYYLLSNMVKILDYGYLDQRDKPSQITKEDLKIYFVKIEEWDSRNAFFFAKEMADKFSKYRQHLIELITEKTDKYFEDNFSAIGTKERADLKSRTCEIESAIKAEVGTDERKYLPQKTSQSRTLPPAS